MESLEVDLLPLRLSFNKVFAIEKPEWSWSSDLIEDCKGTVSVPEGTPFKEFVDRRVVFNRKCIKSKGQGPENSQRQKNVQDLFRNPLGISSFLIWVRDGSLKVICSNFPHRVKGV